MTDKVVRSYGDVCVRESDVALLDGPYWLNDVLISFAFEYLSREKFVQFQDSVAFIGPDTVQLIKFLDPQGVNELVYDLKLWTKKMLLLPVNDQQSTAAGGSHWSLLVYYKEQNCFYHFDPISGANIDAASQIGKVLFPERSEAFVIDFSCPRQSNSYDCGIFTLLFAETVVHQYFTADTTANCDWSHIVQDTAQHKRKQIRDLIFSCKDC